jgi:DNA-binding MarR family transcriptional regulator
VVEDSFSGIMIVSPKIRGFICTTAHPEGCAKHVAEQIAVVKGRGPIHGGPKKVLVIGSSTGYGLSSRIAAAFGCNAATVGVFFERPGTEDKTATAGWYNTVAFEREAKAAGLYARSFNGDAFSDEVKAEVIAAIKEDLGQVDLVIYSLALQDGITASEIASSTAFPKNTLSRAVNRLIRIGLVLRRTGMIDRRQQFLSLTPAGRTIFEEALPRFVALEEEMLAPLSLIERETLSALMAKVVLAMFHSDTEQPPRGD